MKKAQPFELPEYLAFLILGHIKELRKLQPDHILVQAVQDALDKLPTENPQQLELDL